MMITMLTKTTMMMTMMTTTTMMMMMMMMMAVIMSTPITADISLEFLHSFLRRHFAGKPIAKCQLFSQAKFGAEASVLMSQCNQ